MIKRWGIEAVFGRQAVDYGLLNRMTIALNVHDSVKAVRGAVGDQIHKVPESAHATMEWLWKMGLIQP